MIDASKEGLKIMEAKLLKAYNDLFTEDKIKKLQGVNESDEDFNKYLENKKQYLNKENIEILDKYIRDNP